MNGYVAGLARGAIGAAPALRPRPRSRYEPEAAQALPEPSEAPGRGIERGIDAPRPTLAPRNAVTPDAVAASPVRPADVVKTATQSPASRQGLAQPEVAPRLNPAAAAETPIESFEPLRRPAAEARPASPSTGAHRPSPEAIDLPPMETRTVLRDISPAAQPQAARSPADHVPASPVTRQQGPTEPLETLVEVDGARWSADPQTAAITTALADPDDEVAPRTITLRQKDLAPELLDIVTERAAEPAFAPVPRTAAPAPFADRDDARAAHRAAAPSRDHQSGGGDVEIVIGRIEVRMPPADARPQPARPRYAPQIGIAEYRAKRER